MARASNPTALVIEQSSIRVLYLVRWPNTPRKQGKAYVVTVFLPSNRIRVQTATKRHAVSAVQSVKIMPAIRAALIEAGAAISLEGPAS